MRSKLYPWLSTFTAAFVLNLIWENLHRTLYLSYRGGPITQPLLLFVSVKDALLVLFLIGILHLFPKARQYSWLLFIGGVLTAAVIETHALATGRWLYAPEMPLLPYTTLGLSPLLQLGTTAYLSYQWSFKK